MLPPLPSFVHTKAFRSILIAGFLVFYGLLAAVGGWSLRVASEAKNELAVVVDDTEFMKWLEGEIHGWTEEYNQRQEKFYEENPEVPDCLALPMPKHYLNNDYGLQRTQGQPKE